MSNRVAIEPSGRVAGTLRRLRWGAVFYLVLHLLVSSLSFIHPKASTPSTWAIRVNLADYLVVALAGLLVIGWLEWCLRTSTVAARAIPVAAFGLGGLAFLVSLFVWLPVGHSAWPLLACVSVTSVCVLQGAFLAILYTRSARLNDDAATRPPSFGGSTLGVH